MTTYTLGIEEADDGPRAAKTFGSAGTAVEALDEWRACGAAVSIILRGGRPIDETTLRADEEAERTFDVG